MTVLLASGSPRRRELLGRLHIPFQVVPSGVEERPPEPGEDPASYALALARQKAEAVAAQYPNQTVLAADTVVAVDDHILGKPEDAEDALRMLRMLRGRAHTVVTAVAVRCSGQEYAGTVAARVTMRPFSDEEARAYIATGEPMDKAGAYAVQGLGGALVSALEGCYETVVGLPLCLVEELLLQCGVVAKRKGPHCEHCLSGLSL